MTGLVEFLDSDLDCVCNGNDIAPPGVNELEEAARAAAMVVEDSYLHLDRGNPGKQHVSASFSD